MTRRLTWIWLAAALCAAGCGSSSSIQTRSSVGTNGSDACAVTMQRLQSERLPTLKAVKVWDNKYGPGLALITDHYEVLTTVLEPLMLRTLPGFLESAYWAYNDQLPKPIPTSTKFRVYLFATRQQWEDFTRKFAGEQAAVFCKIKTGAYYLNGVCVAYDLGNRTLFALGHEGWHQFNSRHFKYRLPSWLDEGVAMLFETTRHENGTYNFDPSRNVQRLGALRETLDKGRRIPLRDLVAMSPGEALATDQTEVVMAFYSQSYALTRFLREAGYGKRLTCYHRLLWDAQSGEWPLDESAGNIAHDRNQPRTLDWNRQVGLQMFEQYVGPCDQLEQEYAAYCQRLVRDISVVWQDNGARVAVNGRSE